MASLEKPPIDGPLTDKDGRGTDRFKNWLLRLYNRIGGTLGAPAPNDATFITQTPNSELINEQALSLLNSGFIKVTTGSGVLSSTGNTTIQASDLANTTVSTGNYGSATQVGTFTVDAQGRLTAASNTTISGVAPGGSAGGDLGSTYPNPTVLSIANVTTGTLAIANGGTGVTKIPSASAYNTGNTTIAANGYTKVVLNAENWDVGNYFDSTTNSRYTPGIAGIYAVKAQITLTGTQLTTDYGLKIYKNGAGYKWGNFLRVVAASETLILVGSCLVNMNGSSDYIELFCYNSHATLSVTATGDGSSTSQNFLDIVWVGPSS